ncbi:MAG TPA: efflux RND transporter permease subunit [Phycisphaerales bacterium]|nr:efflux RND transporter permease subunit [Phycisphaerales bacterium]
MNDRLSILDRLIRFCLEQKLIVILLTTLIVGWGVAVAPFDWDIDWLPRNPVPVDAIPNLGENQQIVFTEWPGRSPQDVEDQVTYPLTVALMGVPGVREVRSISMFGFSSIFLIFEEGIEFYWSRARIIEKLGSLAEGTLPPGAQPGLGPDATGLGQIFWYTLEGRDPDGHPIGGWDLHELRSVQDWYVRYGLLASEGIAEVASIGGFVREYQVDVDPDAMRAYDVTLAQVFDAVRKSNLDIGARVTEMNRVEYQVRGVGFIKSIEDIEQAVIRVGGDHVPIRIQDVAHVTLGPAERRGVLTQSGAEAVGGVVVVREGFNPLAAINNVKAKIAEIAPGLPAKAVVDWTRITPREVERFAQIQGFSGVLSPGLDQNAWLSWLRANPREAWPDWITTSQLEIVPFYDRTRLIHETLGTLNDALVQQILVTIVVIIVMVMHLRAAMVVSFMLPMAVLMTFIGMKAFGVDANVVALAGIAIAIGAIVDMGIIVSENVLKHLREAPPEEPRLEVVFRGTREVSSAVLTAISTTVISFLPVFAMTGAEGKMFIPLAYTKTFVLIASVIVALTIVPAAVHVFVAGQARAGLRRAMHFGLGIAAVAVAMYGFAQSWWWVMTAGLILLGVAIFHLLGARLPHWLGRGTHWFASTVAAVLVAWLLTAVWEPLGPELGFVRNFIFVAVLIGGLLGVFILFQFIYEPILRWCLNHKVLFFTMPVALIAIGASVWLGFDRVFGFVPTSADRIGLDGQKIRLTRPWVWAAHEWPGLGREFMPRLDEGTFLWMPTTMPHASIGEALEILQFQDMAIASVPEIESVAGKIGRAESALDPAPIGMVETVISYKPQYITDEYGRRINFKFDRTSDEFVRDENGDLIEDPRGRPFRQWRDHIRSPQDIWNELVEAAHLPGATSAPMLMPIETRIVMLQTGMRASMGVKVRAPDLVTLDRMAVQIERLLREVPGINAATVNADRVVGKPYLEIDIDREAIARYGLNIMDVQDVISVAIGGETITTTVEGRERYPVRVRYPRELRGDIEAMERVLVASMTLQMDGDGAAHIPLGELAEIRYVRGPDMIKSEDTFPVAYITFGGDVGIAEVEVVERAQGYLQHAIDTGRLTVPPGVSYRFAGAYEHQLRAARTLSIVLPVALIIIFLILYFQFRKVSTSLIVFSGIAVAWAGGFVMIYFYGQDWFANFDVFGVNMRELFQLHAINLSVAVWVGFLALFGIATDDGVVMATYLRQRFAEDNPSTVADIRSSTIAAGSRRVRPCLMTSATTILALLPVLTSTGRGADIMIPMAIPSLGGMSLVLLSMFTVPVLYCMIAEWSLKVRSRDPLHAQRKEIS